MSSQYGTPFRQNPPPGSVPPGYLVMNVYKMNSFFQHGINPLLWIDQWPVPVRYGQQIIPVAPGRHWIRAQTRSLIMTYGLAQQEIVVAPGQYVELYYAQPMVTFVEGSMGHTPQKPQAKGCLLAILVALGAFWLLLLLVNVVVSAI